MSAQPISTELSRVAQLESSAATHVERATNLAVCDQTSYEIACEMLLGVKELRAEAESHHRPMIKSAYDTWKSTLAGLARVDDPLQRAEIILKPKITAYLNEQERLRKEIERIEHERAEQKAAEEIEACIEAAEAEGASSDEVTAIIEQPAVMPAVYVAPTVSAVRGVSAPIKTYRAEVLSIRELCKAVAEGKVPETYITANLPALNGIARSTKGSLRIPGVRMVEETSVRAGRR